MMKRMNRNMRFNLIFIRSHNNSIVTSCIEKHLAGGSTWNLCSRSSWVPSTLQGAKQYHHTILNPRTEKREADMILWIRNNFRLQVELSKRYQIVFTSCLIHMRVEELSREDYKKCWVKIRIRTCWQSWRRAVELQHSSKLNKEDWMNCRKIMMLKKNRVKFHKIKLRFKLSSLMLLMYHNNDIKVHALENEWCQSVYGEGHAKHSSILLQLLSYTTPDWHVCLLKSYKHFSR